MTYNSKESVQSLSFAASISAFIEWARSEGILQDRTYSAMDVGARDGTGTELLGTMYGNGSHSPMKLEFKAIVNQEPYESNLCRQIPILHEAEFITGDINNDSVMDRIKANSPDVIICSHMIEHVSNPRLIIESLMSACKVMFLASPWRESKLKHGTYEHLSRIDWPVVADGDQFSVKRILTQWHTQYPYCECMFACLVRK